MREIVSTLDAPTAIGPYSQGVKVGNLLFSAGQVALDPKTKSMNNTTLREEIEQIMSNLKAVAMAGGTSLENVVKTTIFLTDLSLFGEINEIYGSYFNESPPARSTVGVASLPAGARVEIEMIFFIPS